MLQCIFLVSDAGEVMLEKQLTGHRVDRSICAWVADVLNDYFGALNEDIIKDNFVIVSNVSDTLPWATASHVPWRTAEPKYTNNEVNVELVEAMDAIINRDGSLVKCEIYGEVQVNSRISGLPDLTLSFTNPSILDDVRVRKLKNTPIYVKPQLTSDGGTCHVSVLVGIRNDPGKTIDSVTVQFQLPPFILSADLTSNHGTVNILAKKTCIWSIGRIPKDKAPSMSGTLVIETGLERLHVFPTFQVGFRIMGVALSGLQIDKLDLKTIPNRFYKGFRALTRAGEFELFFGEPNCGYLTESRGYMRSMEFASVSLSSGANHLHS
ncbi:AP-3 complex subunit mu [Spatholobus suberectus]|nr:AP-3 complex subunit mu [Spatholobus suberectus]